MTSERDIVLKVENLGKLYQLGQIGTGTLSHDLNRWWAGIRGKEDPFSKVGIVNDRTQRAGKREKVWALQDINLEARRGEVLGIIGKNGAGKSTLLKLISNITAPTTGSLKAKGRIASLLEVGTGMHPEMTGRENVYLNGTILGMRRKEINKKFDEIMEFAGCFRYADTPVKRYSSGMKVRLGFAVAAFLEPEILIVDEVLAVGDAEFQKKAIGKMQDVSKNSGRTVIFVSHNMQAIRNLCSSCIVLGNGKVVFAGNTAESVNFYLKNEQEGISENPKIFTEDNSKAFQLLSATLLNEKGQLQEDFECEENIQLELKCKSNTPVPGLFGYLTVSKSDGSLLIESDTFDHLPNVLNSLPPGEQIFNLIIPKKTLAKGEYSIYLNFSSLNYEKFNVDSPGYILKFKINDTLTKRGKNRMSYLSTTLKWSNKVKI